MTAAVYPLPAPPVHWLPEPNSVKTCPQCKMRYPNESTFCFVDGADLVPLEDPRIGTLLAGRYVIEEVLGEGGMATVYRARHKLVDRPCAVKIMSPALAATTSSASASGARRRARRSSRTRTSSRSSTRARPTTARAYMVMELLDGESARRPRRAAGRCRSRARSPIMIQIARALARAHDFEVIHRDLKPENIFLCRATTAPTW